MQAPKRVNLLGDLGIPRKKHRQLIPRLGDQGCLLGLMFALMLMVGAMSTGVMVGRFNGIALLIPLLLAVCLGAGVISPPVALAFMFFSILTEGYQPSLFVSGAVHFRLDELVATAVAIGAVIRYSRTGMGTLSRLLRSVPGLIPLVLFILYNIAVTVLGRKNVGYGFSLIAELAAGVLGYVAIVLFMSEIKHPSDILLPLLLGADAEVFFGLGAIAVSNLLNISSGLGVLRDPGTLLLAPYGTFIEPNFFGDYLAAIAIIVAALLLYMFVRRHRSKGIALALLGLLGTLIAGVLASLTRASWFGFAFGLAIVLLSWRAGRSRDEDAATRAKARTRSSHLLRNSLIAGVAVLTVIGGVVLFLHFTKQGAALAVRFSHLVDFSSGSGGGRIKVLQLVVDDWLHRPILGLGTGSFTGHLPNVQPTDHTWIYSMGLSILHDSGIVGVLIFLAFLWQLYRALWRTIVDVPTSSARALAIGALGAATCLLFAAQSTSSMYLMLLWAFLGLAASMPVLCATDSWHRSILVGPAVVFRLPEGEQAAADSVIHPASAASGNMQAQRGHVLHIYDTGMLGGMQRTLLAIARGLTKHGWTSTALCGNDGPLADDLRKAGIRAIALPIAGTRRFVLSFPRLYTQIRRVRPDVVIVYGVVTGCIGGLAARMAGVPHVVYQSGDPAYYYNWTALKRLRNALVERVACGCASAVWCISRENLQLYLAHRPALPYKFVEIPLSVSQSLIERLPTEGITIPTSSGGAPLAADYVPALRTQLGLWPQERVIGFVGRLAPEKGVDVLLQAYARVVADLPNTLLMLVGEGPEREALQRQAQQLGLGQRVLFLGAQRDVVPFYLLSEVIVVPSYRETFGLVGIEAMAAGRPVIASWVGGMAEAVIDGECGRLVPPGDAAALASAIQWVLQEPERARELGRNGQRRALAEYSEDVMAARVHMLLDILATLEAPPWQSHRIARKRTLDRSLRHVLHILDTGVIGGGPRLLMSAARGMQTQNWTSSVICADDGPLASDLRDAGIETEALPIAGQFRFLRSLPGLIWRIRRQRPDVVIVYGPIAGCLGGLAARLAGVQGVVYEAGYPSYYADRGVWRRVRNAVAEKISCTCADVVWCKSTADVELYQRRKAARGSKFQLVPNCVSNDLLQRFAEWSPVEHSSIERLREQVGLGPQERVIGFVGRFMPWKGVDVLLRAYAEVASRVPQTRLLLVGEGPEREALQRQAQQLGLGQRVLFLGAQRDVVPFYLLSEVLVVPSIYEPFGNVAVEAMAAGRPVVASRVGGLADTVIDGECGRLVPPGDAAALAAALVWLLQEPERARELGRNGQRRALAEYTEARLAERLNRLARAALHA